MTMQGLGLTLMVVTMVVLVINGTIAGYGCLYLLIMMVMGNQIMSQKHRETQGKDQRYEASGFQIFMINSKNRVQT